MMRKLTAIILSVLMMPVICAFAEEAPAEKAEKLLEEMSLRQKIGQMIMVAAREWSDTPEDKASFIDSCVLNDEQLGALRDFNLAGVCLFGKNISDTEQLVRLTEQIQSAAFSSASGIGALISADQEGGYITRLATGTSGIGNMALAAAGDAALARESAEIIAEELQAVGINLDFAPVADVNSNPENPVIGIRSFSDDPETVSEYVGSFLAGFDNFHVTGCLKHFPGHGDTDTDSHTGLPMVNKSYAQIFDTDLLPFRENAGNAEMIMTAHIQFPQIEKETYLSPYTGEEIYIPATMSKTIIKGVLRENLGYDGIVVTDALEMDAISKNFAPFDAAKMIINAGVDMLLMPVDLKCRENITFLEEYIEAIARMVENGEIPEREIDDSVIKILKLKEKKELLEKDEEPIERKITAALSTVGCLEHHQREWEMACKAVTVFKNDNALPLSEADKRSVLYLAAKPDQLLSAYFAKMKLNEAGRDTAGLNITAIAYEDMPFEEVTDKINSASMVILTTAAGALKEADTTDPRNTSAIFCKKAIATAHEQGKKAVVISSRLPYDAPLYGEADAILLCFNPTGMEELPLQYDGHTKKYGANLPAAVYAVLDG